MSPKSDDPKGANDPPLPPVVGTADSWEPVVLHVDCDRCGGPAAVVSLLPPFAHDPQTPRAGEPGYLPGQDTIGARVVRLSIDGPVKVTHHVGEAIDLGIDLAALDGALRAADPVALYRINSEFAPFWCPTCSKSYCRECWTVWVQFADDYPGWYEDTRGRCPEGHVRLIDD
jgi:hypothetical protein